MEKANKSIKISLALLHRLFQASKGEIMFIIIGLGSIKRRAELLGVTEIDVDGWEFANFILIDTPKTKKTGGKA
ncbi:MAG: hypothetical protein AB1403_00525 [Candidatus Riflebacteria bacterium]